MVSAAAPRMARRHSQRRLIRFGFFVTALGLGLLLALGGTNPSVWSYLPGLFLMGVGVGIMLTASVNLVQSAWPERVQGDISGVSRSVSNLGSRWVWPSLARWSPAPYPAADSTSPRS